MFFAVLYGTRLTDMTYAYRIYPTKLVQSLRWEELRHPFLFEALVKPLRLGVAVIEIPSIWKARMEGESQNTFLPQLRLLSHGVQDPVFQQAIDAQSRSGAGIKALITGITGMVGSHLPLPAAARGWETVGLARFRAASRQAAIDDRR